MRLDFNQKGAWRHGPKFTQDKQGAVRAAAIDLADLLEMELRIVDGESGHVHQYWDKRRGWWAPVIRMLREPGGL